jgi:hypothetical protein
MHEACSKTRVATRCAVFKNLTGSPVIARVLSSLRVATAHQHMRTENLVSKEGEGGHLLR